MTQTDQQSPKGRVLILGASGRIGRHSTAAFEAAGWDVRAYDRATGDMTAAAKGCDVIVNGMNPQNYHDWTGIIPQITRNVIVAAKASGATVIIPGNVYHFGDQGGVWSETTPAHPVSRKGQVRLEMEQAFAQSGVQTIVLRAGNFIDPDLRGCVMGAVYLPQIKGGKITLPGPAETRQAMCYLPDWARAAVSLAEMRAQLALFEDIPFAGHTLTGAQIKAGMEQTTGRTLKFTGFPWWVMRLTSPFWELARELREMRYLWSVDHALSGDRLRAVLPEFEVTPIEEVFAVISKATPSR